MKMQTVFAVLMTMSLMALGVTSGEPQRMKVNAGGGKDWFSREVKVGGGVQMQEQFEFSHSTLTLEQLSVRVAEWTSSTEFRTRPISPGEQVGHVDVACVLVEPGPGARVNHYVQRAWRGFYNQLVEEHSNDLDGAHASGARGDAQNGIWLDILGRVEAPSGGGLSNDGAREQPGLACWTKLSAPAPESVVPSRAGRSSGIGGHESGFHLPPGEFLTTSNFEWLPAGTQSAPRGLWMTAPSMPMFWRWLEASNMISPPLSMPMVPLSTAEQVLEEQGYFALVLCPNPATEDVIKPSVACEQVSEALEQVARSIQGGPVYTGQASEAGVIAEYMRFWMYPPVPTVALMFSAPEERRGGYRVDAELALPRVAANPSKLMLWMMDHLPGRLTALKGPVAVAAVLQGGSAPERSDVPTMQGPAVVCWYDGTSPDLALSWLDQCGAARKEFYGNGCEQEKNDETMSSASSLSWFMVDIEDAPKSAAKCAPKHTIPGSRRWLSFHGDPGSATSATPSTDTLVGPVNSNAITQWLFGQLPRPEGSAALRAPDGAVVAAEAARSGGAVWPHSRMGPVDQNDLLVTPVREEAVEIALEDVHGLLQSESVNPLNLLVVSVEDGVTCAACDKSADALADAATAVQSMGGDVWTLHCPAHRRSIDECDDGSVEVCLSPPGFWTIRNPGTAATKLERFMGELGATSEVLAWASEEDAPLLVEYELGLEDKTASLRRIGSETGASVTVVGFEASVRGAAYGVSRLEFEEWALEPLEHPVVGGISWAVAVDRFGAEKEIGEVWMTRAVDGFVAQIYPLIQTRGWSMDEHDRHDGRVVPSAARAAAREFLVSHVAMPLVLPSSRSELEMLFAPHGKDVVALFVSHQDEQLGTFRGDMERLGEILYHDAVVVEICVEEWGSFSRLYGGTKDTWPKITAVPGEARERVGLWAGSLDDVEGIAAWAKECFEPGNAWKLRLAGN